MFKPFGQFRFKSIFVSIFASILVINIIVSVLFAFFFTNSISKTAREYALSREASALEKKAETVDYILREDIHQSMVQMAYSGNVLSIAISKEMNNMEVNEAVVDIAFGVKYNPLIDRIAIYYPLQDYVIVSDYTTTTLKESADCPVIEYYQKYMNNCPEIRSNEKTTNLFCYEDQYIMAFDYPIHGEKRLATIYYYLNEKELFSSVKEEGENRRLYVYDADNHLIQGGEKDAAVQEASEALADTSELTGRIEKGGKVIFYRQSELTGWKYYYSVSDVGVNYSDMVWTLIRFMILLLIGCLIAAYILTGYIYNPLKKLISTLDTHTDSNKSDIQAENEIDMIGQIIDVMKNRNTHLSNYMQAVSFDVTGRMFLDIINGNYMMASDAEKLLNSLLSPFDVYRIYSAWQIRVLCDGQLSYETHTRCNKFLNEEFGQMQKKVSVVTQVVTVSQGVFAVIVMYRNEQSDFAVKKTIADEKRHLLQAAQKRGFSLQAESGNPYHSMLDIGFSYKEAGQFIEANAAVTRMETLQEKNEADKKAEIKDRPTPAESPAKTASGKKTFVPEQKKIRRRSEQIIAMARKEQKKEALELLQRALDEECLEISTKEEALLLYDAYLTAFVGTIAELQNFNYSANLEELLKWNREEAETMETSEILLDLLRRLNSVVEECEYLTHKKNNKHLMAAVQYIEEHYQDPDLSLNVLSTVTGMNASYLSRFFRDNLNIGFSTYVNNLRLEKAAEKLAATKVPVNQIAAECGFSTIQNFMRQFKKVYGKTPREYRTEKQENRKKDE